MPKYIFLDSSPTTLLATPVRKLNIDVDVILAAQVLTSGLLASDTVIATSNLRHLGRFTAAELWQNIQP